MQSGYILELDQATVIRNGERILDGLSLKVRNGEHTAIIGPNGSGKSSLIKLLTLQLYPLAHTDGSPSVRVFERERWSVFDLRKQLGIVSSEMYHALLEAHTVNRLTATQAVLSGFFASLGYFEQSQINNVMRERAHASLVSVGASSFADKPIDQLSTGEARRVLIARALVHEPQALVLDEPTTGLDLVARQRFMQTVRDLANRGCTVILVTHHFDEVIPEIQRVVLLQRGRVAFAGAKADALQSDKISSVFEHTMAIEGDGGYFHARVI